MSAMTGEAMPIDVEPGSSVIGGTVVANGFVTVEASRVGADTQLAQMLRLVEDAQNEKAGAQRLADRIRRYLFRRCSRFRWSHSARGSRRERHCRSHSTQRCLY